MLNKVCVKTVKLFMRRNGFGMNELLGIAAALIIAAFVIIPALRIFAGDVMDGLDTWWTNTVVRNIFPAA